MAQSFRGCENRFGGCRKTLFYDSIIDILAPVAQGIEQWFPKPCVGCSIHLGRAIFIFCLKISNAQSFMSYIVPFFTLKIKQADSETE